MIVLQILPDENVLFYSLAAIKNVGFEAISNLVNERKKWRFSKFV